MIDVELAVLDGAGLATSAAILIAARAVQGRGAASIAPASLALMMNLFHSTVQG